MRQTTYATTKFEYYPRRNIFIEQPNEPYELPTETSCGDCEDGIYDGNIFISVDNKDICFTFNKHVL